MTAFEKYLMDSGYVPHRFDNGKWIPTDYKPYSLSAPGRLQYRFIHPKRKRYITFGLDRPGHGPVLISPLPRSAWSPAEANRMMHYEDPDRFLRKLIR